MGARSGGGGGAGLGGGNSLQKAASAMSKAFYSKGAINYVNGSNNPADVKAWDKYQKAKSDFAKVWDKTFGKPAFDDYSSAMQDVLSGNL